MFYRRTHEDTHGPFKPADRSTRLRNKFARYARQLTETSRNVRLPKGRHCANPVRSIYRRTARFRPVRVFVILHEAYTKRRILRGRIITVGDRFIDDDGEALRLSRRESATRRVGKRSPGQKRTRHGSIIYVLYVSITCKPLKLKKNERKFRNYASRNYKRVRRIAPDVHVNRFWTIVIRPDQSQDEITEAGKRRNT